MTAPSRSDRLRELTLGSTLSPGRAFADRHALKGRGGPELGEFAYGWLNKTSTLPLVRVLAAETLLDVAMQEDMSTEIDTVLQYIADANSALEKVIKDDLSTTGLLGSVSLRASILATFVPTFQTLALEQNLPSQQTQENVYETLLKLCARVQSQYVNKENVDAGFTNAAADLLGLICLQRYGWKTNDSHGIAPLPTTFSSDQAGFINGEVRKGWDISVLSNLLGEPTKPTYKIKMKAHETDLPYSDDIVVIVARSLRQTRSGKTLGWGTTFGSYVNEETEYLDVIEDRMLTELDAFDATEKVS